VVTIDGERRKIKAKGVRAYVGNGRAIAIGDSNAFEMGRGMWEKKRERKRDSKESFGSWAWELVRIASQVSLVRILRRRGRGN